MEEATSRLLAQLEDLDLLWDPIDAPRCEATFRTLLEQVQQWEERDPSAEIELLALIGRAEGQQKRLPEAAMTLKQGELRLEEHKEECRTSAKIRLLLESGRLHILMKTPSQARLLFSNAWTLATEAGEDFFAVEIAEMMALIEPQKAQQAWVERAIGIAEKSTQPKAKRWLGPLQMNLGWKLHGLRQFDKALAAFKRAQVLLEEGGTLQDSAVARWSIGKVLRALGRTEEALQIQQSIVETPEHAGQPDGRVYEEIAECLQTLRKTEEAQRYFELAYREFSSDEWISDNQPLKLKRMKDLGKVKG